MKSMFGLLCVASLLVWGFSTAALAQSPAVIVPGAVAEGTTPAAPAKPLDILDTDYPLESLLANEEGKIQLNLTVSERGEITAAEVLAPTKLPSLELQAINVARSRWQFTPAIRGGVPVAAQVNVDVEWKLPLVPVYEYQMLEKDEPVARTNTPHQQPELISHEVKLDDFRVADAPFPFGNRTIVVRFLISENGNVGESKVIRSSDYRAIDDRAYKVIRERFKFKPASFDGKPIKHWQYVRLNFVPERAWELYTPDAICTSEPVLGDNLSLDPKRMHSAHATQHVHFDRDGFIDDAIILTEKGWKRLRKTLLEKFSGANHIQRLPVTRRGTSCWLDRFETLRPIALGPPSTRVWTHNLIQ